MNPFSIISLSVFPWLYTLTVSDQTNRYFIQLINYNIILYKSYYVSDFVGKWFLNPLYGLENIVIAFKKEERKEEIFISLMKKRKG